MSSAVASSALTADQHQLLVQLVVAARLDGETTTALYLREFTKSRQHQNVINMRTLLQRLGETSASARLASDTVAATLGTCNPIDALRRFLATCGQPDKPAKPTDGSKSRKSRESSTSSAVESSGGAMNRAQPAAGDADAATASKLMDVKRRVAAAASVGLSKSARASHLAGTGSASSSQSAGAAGKENSNQSGTGSQHQQSGAIENPWGHPKAPAATYEDAFALRRRQTLWQINHTDAAPFRPQSALALPAQNQEQLLIGELLYSLCGIGGTFIRAMPGERAHQPAPEAIAAPFTISEQINASQRNLVAGLLQLGGHYTRVDDFVVRHSNEYHPGATAGSGTAGAPGPRGSQVLQALAAAMRRLLLDYQRTVCALEAVAGQLTLPKLVHMLRPTAETMAVLAQTVSTVERGQLRGAAVLSALHERVGESLGAEARQAVLEHLLEQAAVPYVRTLELWIVKGVVVDPHREFMIEERKVLHGEPEEESYWNSRYVVRTERMPAFVADVADVVQRTGKYLNVIRQCGEAVDAAKVVQVAEEEGATEGGGGGVGLGGKVGASGTKEGIGGVGGEQLRYSATSGEHLVFINKAYHYASHRLLELLVNENDLMGHLASVKRYLLMQQGDFIEQFMDVVEEELSKNIDLAMPIKLENLLGLVLRTTSAKDDKYIDELRVQIYDCDLQTQMEQINRYGSGTQSQPDDVAPSSGQEPLSITGFEGFSFDYEVRWPVSLVINNFSLTYYKTVFRLLFYFKHVQRQLGRMWIHNKNVKRFESGRMSDVQRSTFSLSHRMIHAVQNIEYYVMLEVVEPLWQQFLASMATVENVDQVILAHNTFTCDLVERTMLRMPELLHTLTSMCRMCLDFARMVMAQTDMRETEEFARKVVRCNEEFTALLLDLLAKINGNQLGSASNRFVNLVHRLNFNSFYSDRMEAKV